MRDEFNREINYLRISVTDRCNLRCVYCMPEGGILHKDPDRILSFEEISLIVKAAVDLGIWKVRITGGEPLVRRGLPALVEKLKKIKGLKDLALTTNGIYLSDYARSLKAAGLDRVNISLDSLNPEKFRRITRGGDLKKVIEGIDVCISLGYAPIKINAVLMGGFNTDEIPDFVNLVKARSIHVRFIEYMPTGLSGPFFRKTAPEDLFFSAAEAKNICNGFWKLEPAYGEQSGTAKVFSIEGFQGKVGFIAPISEPFCSSCNKLRLTSDGHLRSCLHSSRCVDLKEAIGNGASERDLAMLIERAAILKPKSHKLSDEPIGIGDLETFSMCQIGG